MMEEMGSENMSARIVYASQIGGKNRQLQNGIEKLDKTPTGKNKKKTPAKPKLQNGIEKLDKTPTGKSKKKKTAKPELENEIEEEELDKTPTGKNKKKKTAKLELQKEINGIEELDTTPTAKNKHTPTTKKMKKVPAKAQVKTGVEENVEPAAKTPKKKKRKLEDKESSDVKPKKIKKNQVSSPKEEVNVAIDMEDSQENCDATELQDGFDEEDSEVKAVLGKSIGACCLGNSKKQGLKDFNWMISPVTKEEFFRIHWEKKPLLIKRDTAERNYFQSIFSTAAFDAILRNDRVMYTKNLDITSYRNGERETHNPVGQAHSSMVWDFFNSGCSVRMLNPQTFHEPVWKFLYSLQEFFNCFCGANVYLTPPNTQGFAPHWDDIEAFVIQLEGKKHWKVYAPRNEDETLPVNSSKNLSQEELGKPVLDVTLLPGDVLYFPRGYIHQAQAVEDKHSLHITVSTYQRNTWGHYLQKLLPQAIAVAMVDDVEFRKGLPRNYLDVMGIINMDVQSPGRTSFLKKTEKLVTRLLQRAPLDATVDQLGATFMHDALPPPLTPKEKLCSARNGGEKWCSKKNKVDSKQELDPTMAIRLIRGNCVRLVAEGEGDGVNLYHCLTNTREYHEEDPQFLEVTVDQAPAVEALLHAYPKYIAIEDLPMSTETDKFNLANGLWERGLLVVAKPLKPADDN